MSELEESYVDSHFHIWELKRFPYLFPTPDMGQIYRDLSADAFLQEVQQTSVQHAVFIQVVNDNIDEAVWVNELAGQYDLIKGIVAGVDLAKHDFAEKLGVLSGIPRVVGIRHIPDFEPSEPWLSRPDVLDRLPILENYNYTLDILVRPDTIPLATEAARRCPGLKFVVDHMAKPNIREGVMTKWKNNLEQLARHPNVYCKLSGMVTEADLENWTEDHLLPYVKHVMSAFGPERCMYGSDWPVCTMARGANYRTVLETLKSCLKRLDYDVHTTKVFRNNAIKFYGLKNIN